MVSLLYNSCFDYWTTKSIIDGFLKNNSSTQFEVLIRCINKDEKLEKYFSEMIDYENVSSVSVDDEEGDVKFERLLNEINGEYVIGIPEKKTIFVEKDCITELIYHSCNIEKSGVISLKSTTKDLILTPLPMSSKDEFMYVWKNQKNEINFTDLWFFKKELLSKINDIDMINNELSSMGYHNYYLSNKNCFNV